MKKINFFIVIYFFGIIPFAKAQDNRYNQFDVINYAINLNIRNISAKNISELWWIMIWLGGMFVGGVAGQISSSAFYASGDTKTPTRIGIYSYTFYMPLKIVLFYFYGVQGIAIITSAFFLVNLFFQNHLLQNNGTKF